MQSRFQRLSARWILVLVGMVGAGGCRAGNEASATIEGSVAIDGKPLENGSILFVPVEGTGGTATGGRIDRGRYHIGAADRLAVGRNRVEIRAVRKTGKVIPDPFAGPGGTMELFEEAVAAKFNSQSGLTVDVKPGNNTADFQVTP